jgi:hypothetical protein
MSKEMQVDEDFTVAAISTGTSFSDVAYLIWISAVGAG